MKLLVILGAGSSIPVGMPSVTCLDEQMAGWGREWAERERCQDYFGALRQSIESYYQSRICTLCPPVTFEKIMGEMLALSHWVTPSPWGDTLRQVICGDARPRLLFPNAEYHGPAIALRCQLGYLLSKLAEHMRLCSHQLDIASEPFLQYSAMFEALRQSFDVGIFNLNYDNAALTAMPGAYTGFGKDGKFEPHAVHARTEWGHVYHLHGSVHHSLIQPNIDQVFWQNDLAGEFVDSDGGVGPKLRSEGRLFPKATLLAGGFKLDQLLVEPFHSFQAAFVRHIYAADAILVGGYGFGDAHVNWALSNRLSSPQKRPPVLILDRRSARAHSTSGRWATDLCMTMGTDESFFSDVTRTSGGASPEILRGGSFEVATEHRLALWHGGFVEGASRVDGIVAWLRDEIYHT